MRTGKSALITSPRVSAGPHGSMRQRSRQLIPPRAHLHAGSRISCDITHPHIAATKPNPRRRCRGNFPGAAGFMTSDTSTCASLGLQPSSNRGPGGQMGVEPNLFYLHRALRCRRRNLVSQRPQATQLAAMETVRTTKNPEENSPGLLHHSKLEKCVYPGGSPARTSEFLIPLLANGRMEGV